MRPEDIKTINRRFFLDTGTSGNYLKSDFLDTPPVDTLRTIDRVRNGDIKDALRAVAPFGQASVRRAWSHHVCLHSGLHFWPDANHRTGVVSFNLALERGFGWMLGLPEDAALRLIDESKAFRKANRPLLKIKHLKDPGNAYCKLFQEYEPLLSIRAATPDGGLY